MTCNMATPLPTFMARVIYVRAQLCTGRVTHKVDAHLITSLAAHTLYGLSGGPPTEMSAC